MRKMLVMLALVFTFTVAVNAQTPQSGFEGAAVVQYDRANFDARTSASQQFIFNRNTDGVGVGLELTGFVVKNAGLTAAVSGTFSGGLNSNSLLTALGGVTLKVRSNPRFQPFARVLAGVARQRVAKAQVNFNDFSDTNFAGLVGAGLDINLKRDSRYKFRLIAVDYMRTSAFDAGTNGFVHGGQNHIRISSGLVW